MPLKPLFRERKRLLAAIALLLFFAAAARASEEVSLVVEGISIGYNGAYRPGEWTPFSILLASETGFSGEVSVVVRKHISFSAEADVPAGATRELTLWCVFEQPKAGFPADFAVVAGGNTLFSALDKDDRAKISVRAIPSYRPIIAVLSTDLYLDPQTIHDISVIVREGGALTGFCHLPPERLPEAWQFLESIDVLITAKPVLKTLEKADSTAAKTVTDFGKTGRRLIVLPDESIINDSLLSLIRAEAENDVYHQQLFVNPEVAQIAAPPQFPRSALSRTSFTIAVFAFGAVMLVLAAGYSRARHPRVFYSLLPAAGITAIVSLFLLLPRSRVVEQQFSIIRSTGAGIVETRFSAFSTFADREHIDLDYGKSGLHPVYYSRFSPAAVPAVFDASEGLIKGVTLVNGAYPTFVSEALMDVQGGVFTQYDADKRNLRLFNALGFDVEAAYLYWPGHFGGAEDIAGYFFTLGTVKNGTTCEVDMRSSRGFPDFTPRALDNPSTACRKRLLAYFYKRMLSRAHVTLFGITAPGTNAPYSARAEKDVDRGLQTLDHGGIFYMEIEIEP